MPLTEEQLEAVQSIDKHVLVSAGAGSGKTSVLVERYLEVLRCDAEANVSDIIAVTFTRKAAEEMRTRLKEGLKKLADQAPGAEESARWRQCLVEIESSRIGTIHSLCEFLLKTRSTTAAVDPRFELLDDLERAQLLDESIRDAIHFVLDQPRCQFNELLDFPLEQITEMLKQLLSSSLRYGEACKPFLNATNPGADATNEAKDLQGQTERIRAFASTFVQATYRAKVRQLINQREFRLNARYILDTPWADRQNGLALKQDEVTSLLERLLECGEEDADALQELAQLELSRAGGPAGATLRAAIKAIRDSAKEVTTKLQPDLNDADTTAFAVISSLLSAADRARNFYERGKQRHQKLDFDDLILRTAALVQTAESGSGLAMHNIRALLIDEFQDTNSIQARMLAGLAAGSKLTRLFLIGDDKQSIYKFQGADVGTFNLCKGFIASLNGDDYSQPRTDRQTSKSPEPQPDEAANNSASAHAGVRVRGNEADLEQTSSGAPRASAPGIPGWPSLSGQGQLGSLSLSFRSHPAIVEFVNVLFHRLFDAGEDAEAFRSRFQALNAARRDNQEQQRVEIITFTADQNDSDEPSEKRQALSTAVAPSQTQIEAKLVAKYILEAKARKITVLEKDSGSERPVRFGDFAVLLQANGDFAAIEAALSEAEIPYISFAGAGYLERQEILDLENLLKWLLSPQDGHALLAALRSPLFGISDDIIHDLKSRNSPSLWSALRQAAAAEQDTALLAAASLLKDCLDRCGQFTVDELIRYILKRSSFDIILSAIPAGKQRSRNLWKFVDLAARHNHLGLRGFLDCLQAMRDNNIKNLSDAPLTADDAVKIMTIHKSKGLEFGVVVLPRCNRRAHAQSSKMLFGKEFGIAIDTARESDEIKPAFFQAADALNKMLDEEEKKRLLYVAVTRARDHLAILVPAKPGKSLSFEKWLRDGLDLRDIEGSQACPLTISVTSAGRTASFVLRSMVVDDTPPSSQLEPRETEKHDSAEPSCREAMTDPSLTDSQSASQQPPPTAIPHPDDIDLSLLATLNKPAGQMNPVPWQSLVRATPSLIQPEVHATILGNYFHLLMDRLCQFLDGVSLETMQDLLVHPQVAVYHPAWQHQLLEEGAKLIAIFRDSQLMTQMQTARRLIHETSYFTMNNGRAQSECRPDLIIEDQSGAWSIVDFKTDHFDLAAMGKQAKTHQAQLQGYAGDFQHLTGIEPRAYVYFAQHGILHELDCRKPVQLKLIQL